MRKALTYAFLFLASHISVASAAAAYVIKLKNGNEYVTMRYWNEGGQVCFDTYDGIFGIEKNFIEKIEKSDKVIRMARASDQDLSAKPQKSLSKESEAPPPNQKSEDTVKKERDPNDAIVGEFDRLKEKAGEVDGMLTSEIRELLNQITVFKNKLAKDSKAFIEYAREFNDLNELGSTVETALRSRTQ